jgi:hypothetical protein
MSCSLARGPQIAWNLQMKDSCRLSNQRVYRKSIFVYLVHLANSLTVPGRSKTVLPVFTVRNGTAYEADTMYLGTHDSLVNGSNQTCQRLTGRSTDGTYIACDIDTFNRTWSLYSLNAKDLAIRRQATGKDTLDDTHSGIWTSRTQTVIPTLIQYGTFSLVNKENKHLFITELDVAMAKYWDFRDSFEQQPFLRIFDINNLNQSVIDTMPDSEWSLTRDGSRIIMRTASFGHGRKRLDMCVREESAFASQKPRVWTVHGLHEMMFVPLAIVQAFRVQWTFEEEKVPPPLGLTRRERRRMELEEIYARRRNATALAKAQGVEAAYSMPLIMRLD